MAPKGLIGKLWITPSGKVYRALLPRQKTDELSRKARTGYRNQKHYAKAPFLLTFEQWWNVWQNSGCWANRGILPHQYCMARGTPEKPDVGPYELTNIRIITNKQNRAEQGMDYMNGNKHALGSKHTEEWKRQASLRNKGNKHAANRTWPKEDRIRISEAMKKVWRRRALKETWRRQVIRRIQKATTVQD